ncbi:MAG: hypothetical protein ACRD9S_23265 [Pyrinomonadaceae bacterium]
MTTDEVCASYATRGTKVTCRTMDDSVLIEGDRETLEFLGNLILAQAGDVDCCHKSIAPNAAGSALFTTQSNVGIYIHRLPCDHEPALSSSGGA